MHDRRGGRPSQVRPRPPSNGRPAPAPARPRKPAPGRRQSHRPIERSRGLPLGTRLLLVAAVVGVGLTLILTATGGIGRIVTALGASVDGVVAGLTATPTPRPTVHLVPDVPGLEKPDEPYTNQQAIDIEVTLPPDVPGTDSVVRLWLGLPGGDVPLRVVEEVPVGTGPTVVIPGVALAIGRNDFTATIEGPGGESERSEIVTHFVDLAKPVIEITTPADGEEINADKVVVNGKTQGRTSLIARSGSLASTSVIADENGVFSVELPLGKGRNSIGLTATDPAGNVNTHLFSVVRGDGKLDAKITADPPAVDVSRLPLPMKLTVLVTDPDEKPLPDAQVTFTLSVPGIQVVTAELVTGADGTALFETTVPKGAQPGEGVVAVLVRTESYGETTATLEFDLAE